jgi:multiple sugar transport system substrate-binding protein/sn-glycerol 3-phosphate transport system substrate-binding protein
MPFYQTDINTVAEEQGREPDVWGVAAIPHTTDEPVMNVYGGDIIMTRTTPEQELAAWIFVKWFTSPEIQAEWDKISGYFPTRASTQQYLGDIVDQLPQYAEALDLLPYGKYEPQLISYTQVRDDAQKAFNEIMQGADVQATLDQLTQDANDAQAEAMAEMQ